MDIQAIDIEEIEDIEDLAVIRIPKRYIRDANNPFEFYEELEFKRRFRFCKESILYGLLPKIEQYLTKINNRGLPISPAIQLLVCLRFYASASFQMVIGETLALSQPTISRIIFRVSALLASLIKECIKMPTIPERKNENYRLFRVLGYGNGAIGLPGIDGAIDCTHIRLTHTRFHGIDEVYRNRKGYFSLNVQTVVGPRMEFLDIVPEYPGSQHDSRIFQNSRIYMQYVQGKLNGKLVGDSGYPTLPFLLTPIGNPQTDEQLMYNTIHGRTRQIVERTYGAQWGKSIKSWPKIKFSSCIFSSIYVQILFTDSPRTKFRTGQVYTCSRVASTSVDIQPSFGTHETSRRVEKFLPALKCCETGETNSIGIRQNETTFWRVFQIFKSGVTRQETRNDFDLDTSGSTSESESNDSNIDEYDIHDFCY